jgi:hypothetical protein
MINKYLRAFVIGSSFLICFPFMYVVSTFKSTQFNFKYKRYSFLAPFVLWFVNLLSLIIAEKFRISNRNRLLYASIITPTIVLITVKFLNIYNYTTEDWISHIIGTYALYFIVFNIILYNLDKYV